MISPDAHAILLLCSRLALKNDDPIKPLTLKQWNFLARQIATSELQRPGELFSHEINDLGQRLHLDSATVKQIAAL